MSRTNIEALFANETLAKRAIHHFLDSGYKKEDITLLMSDKNLGEQQYAIREHRRLASGGGIGAAIGGGIGALVSGVSAVGAITLPGGTGLFAAGPIVAAFTGAGAAGTAGGLLGALIGAGFKEHEAQLVEHDLDEGHILIGINIDASLKSHYEKELRMLGARQVTVH